MTTYKEMKSISFDNGNTVYNITDASVGNLSSLTTPDKTNIVSAINSMGNMSYTAKCPAITPVDGIATWVITHNMGSLGIVCSLYTKTGVEIVKNTTINSANQITVTFNTSVAVAAEDYTINILANGGATAISNHAQLDNLDYASSGHTGFMSDENYIPSGTTINVELDGTGDFTNLSDACEYIQGKYSDGDVVIKLGEGTFILDSQLLIETTKFNFAQLRIEGEGTSTIIQGTSSNNLNISREGTSIWMSNVDFNITDGNKTKYAMAVVVRLGARFDAYRCNFTGGGILVYRNAQLQSEISSFSNVESAIRAQSGSIVACAQTQVFNNVTSAFTVSRGGIITMHNCKCTFTDTNNKFTQVDEGRHYNPSAGGVYYPGYDGIIMGRFTQS